ncbi:hypothetical protein [Phormidium sp. CCY1219]|uniref:hypothetical protein n=1 Tax=Phormidium sp. CCY1219 TaxID=2886104 RepID=UPI002D1F9571|nr:hypothetical protein [Phormidium sp. CCY1219]MEB3826622.1 hypothetical protein [Phormidium sp. CCY1219]
MASINDPLPWEVGLDIYVPILHERSLVGFCRPEYSEELVEMLNEQEKLRKALRLACGDLLRQRGADKSKVNELMEKYLEKCQRPRFGPRAIAALLQERQQDLQVSTSEFIKFCETYKVSRQNLKEIFAGQEISDRLIIPLARILGKTQTEVLEILHGTQTDEL